MAGKYDKEIKIKVTDGGQLKRTTKDVNKLNKAQNRINKSSQSLDRNMKGNARMSSNASKNFSKQAQGMQGVLVPAYAEVAARVFALTAAFTALSSVANYNILIKGQSEYAKMTGKNLATIARSVQVASKHMLDFKEASSSVALASTSGLGSKQIIRMTKAAVDSSAALGRSVTDTMDRLTRGIVKAEPEILDEIGVIIRLDTVYKNYAQSVSKATAELTEGEKATARYNAIIGQLETKFGGIASKLDPNYFQALAATVLDLTNRFGTLVIDGLNPILSWLSKAKGVLAVFMALIVKSLVGKMFPIFSTFGKKISSMPKKMGKNIDKLEKKIQRLNSTMVKGSKVTASMVKKQAESILTKDQRGAAFDKNPLGSTGATLRQARASVKDGVVSFGKLKDISSKTLKGMEKDYDKLNNTIKKGLPLQIKATANVHQFQQRVLGAKKMVTQFASSQIRSWTFVSRAIDNRGVIAGVSLSVRMLGKAWDKAALSATWYGKAAAGANVAIMAATGAASILGKAISKAGAIGMALYGLYQVGKLAVGIFWDLDTPFIRAAAAADELNSSVEKSLEAITEMDPRISMDGYASNALEALRNADFASNMGEELYNATSKAMHKLKADISTRTFWDDFADFFKSIIGDGFKDSLGESITQGLSAMDKLKFNTGASDKMLDDLYKKQGGQDQILKVVGKKQTSKGMRSIKGMVDANRQDKIALLTEEQRIKVLATVEQSQKRAAESSKIYAADLKSIGVQFDNVAKSAKTYRESLIIATSVDDMATAQKEIKKVWEDGSLSGSDMILQAQAKGFTDSKDFFIKELESAQKAQLEAKKKWLDDTANDDKDWATSEIFKTAQKEISEAAQKAFEDTSSYLDLLGNDWVKMQKEALVSTTNRITAETKLNLLQKFSNKSSIKEQAKTAKAIAVAKWSEAAAANELLKKDSNASQEQKNQSAAKLLQLKIQSNLAGARELDIQKEINTRRGTTLTLTEEYDAKLKDLKATIVSLSNVEQTAHLKAFATERAAAAEKALFKIINASNKHFKSLQKIKSIESDINEIVKGRQFLTSAAKDKFKLKLTRLALLHLTKEGKQIKSRHKAIDAELENIGIEAEHWMKGEVILDYRLRVAKIEREISDVRFKKEKKILAFRELALSKARLEANIVRAETEKMYSFIRQGFTEANNQFSTSIATVVSDLLMSLDSEDKPKTPNSDDIKYFIAKTLSDQVGSFVAYQAEKGLKWLEKGALKLMGFDEDQIREMLPKDPIQDMVDTLKRVETIEGEMRDDVKKGRIDWTETAVATSALAQGGTVDIPEWKKLMDEAKGVGTPAVPAVKADLNKGIKAVAAVAAKGVDAVVAVAADLANGIEAIEAVPAKEYKAPKTPELERGKYLVNMLTLQTTMNRLLMLAGKDTLSLADIEKKLISGNPTLEEKFKAYDEKMVWVGEQAYAAVISKLNNFPAATLNRDVIETFEQTVERLVKSLGAVNWELFGKATLALSEGYKPDSKPDAAGNVEKGGFSMYGFTPEVGKAMEQGMNALSAGWTKDGFKILGFKGEELAKASSKIINVIDSGFLKVLGFKGKPLEDASNAIVSALKDGNQFRVHVMNFSEMPAPAAGAAAGAAAPTDLDKLKEEYPTIKEWTDGRPSLTRDFYQDFKDLMSSYTWDIRSREAYSGQDINAEQTSSKDILGLLFDTQNKGIAALKNSVDYITKHDFIPKDAAIFTNPADFLFPNPNDIKVYKDFQTTGGLGDVNAMHDGKDSQISIRTKMNEKFISEFIHENAHEKILKQLNLKENLADFDKSMKVSYTEFQTIAKDLFAANSTDQSFKDTSLYPENAVVEEIVVRAFQQLAFKVAGTTPQDVIPKEIWDTFELGFQKFLTGYTTLTPKSEVSLSKSEPDAEPDLGFWAGVIDDGITPSVNRLIKSVESNITNSQDLLRGLTQSSLITIDATIAAHVGIPLKAAAADIEKFIKALDENILPTLAKFDNIDGAKLATLIDEMGKTLITINKWTGPEDAFKWGDLIPDNPFSDKVTDDISTTAKILEEEQGPNSFNVFDNAGERAAKAQTKAIQDMAKRIGTAKERGTDKKAMAEINQKAADNRAKYNSDPESYNNSVSRQVEIENEKMKGRYLDQQMRDKMKIAEAKRLSTLRAADHAEALKINKLKDLKNLKQKDLFKPGGGGSAGAHKFGPFDTSGRSPYYPARDFAETRKARDLQKSQVNDLKTKGVHQTIKDLSNKMDIEQRGNFGKGATATDIEQTRRINKLIDAKAAMVEKARANIVKSAAPASADASSVNINLTRILTNFVAALKEFKGPLAGLQALFLSKGLGGDGGDMLSEEDVLLQQLYSLVDVNTSILNKMPEVEKANAANTALVNADDGAGNSLGTNIHNPEDINGSINSQAASLASDATSTLKSGFKDVVMGGHVDAKAMLSGIAQRAGGRALDSIFDTIIGAILPWANGGIVTGGFRAFANGGTVTKPTLGLVGEGKYNEAVVPLPDGKSIPVIGATGSTENNITVNVTVDSNGKASTDTSGGSSKDNAKQLGYMVSQAVQSEIVSQQRPGGLLSQY
jgi:hypothetical protein